MRSTREMRRLATVLLAGDAEARFHSEELRSAAHVPNRRLVPMLTLLLQRGWLAEGWDELSTTKPPRYYVLTDLGRHELARAHPSA